MAKRIDRRIPGKPWAERFVRPYKPRVDPMQRFLGFVVKTDTCWLWAGPMLANGYGSFQFRRKACGAHRVSWELFRGEPADGLCVLHRCDNPKCVNPDHLFLGTNRENTHDKVRKGRQLTGVRCWNAISPTVVERILESEGPHKVIADRFGVAMGTVTNIKNGRHWYFRGLTQRSAL